MSLQEVENAISAMNQAAFQELGDLLEDRHSGHRINPHGSPDCPRNYELHGPRPTRHLNRWLVNLSASAISTQEVADLFCHSDIVEVAHARHSTSELSSVLA
jgi:hypothetical protein